MGTISRSGGLYTVKGEHTYAKESAANHHYEVIVTIKHETAPPEKVPSKAEVSDPAVLPTDGFTVTAFEGASSDVTGTQLVVTAQPPSIITAGAGFAVTIAAEDPFGNIDATFDGSVTLALANNPASGTLGGTLSVPAVNGLAFFSGLTIDHSGNGYTLQASKAGLTPALTSAIDITVPGVATQLVVTTQPPSGVVAGSSFGLVVAAEDSFGTVDTAFNGSVTVSDANGGIALGTITACNGVATFSGLTLDDAGDYSLSVTSNGLSAAATNSLTVRAAPASQVIVLDPIGNILSGAPFDIDIVLVDSDGNIDQTFTGNVTLALANNPGSSTLGGTVIVSAVDGVATFSGLTINNSGIGYAFQATSAGLTTGTSSPFNVSNDQLVVTTQPPSTVAAGSGFGLVVAAEDGSGDVDTSFHGAVTVALDNDLGGSGLDVMQEFTVNAVNGVATFSNLTLDQAGDYVLSLTSDGLGGATTDLFSVTPVAATQLVVTAQPPSIITAGAGFAVTIAAEDPFGNIDATFDGSVTLALANNPASGTLGGTLSVPAVNGLAFFSGLTIDHSGNGYTLQASKAGLTPALTSAIDITVPGVATQLVVTTQPPSGVVAGSSFGLVVAAEDSFGTVDTAFNGSVTVSDANGGIALGTITACNGAATFSGLTLDDAGDYSLSVTSNGLSAAATNSLTVRAAPASQVIVLDPIGNILSGAPFDIDIVLVDSDGNIDQTFTGNVTLALANNPGSSTLGGTVIVSAVDGVATFSGLTINNSGIGYAFQATSAGLTTGTSSPFNVSNDQLVVTTQPPSTVAAGSGFGLVVAAEDGSGDVDTSFHGAVTVALDNDLGGSGLDVMQEFTVNAVNGVATFSNLTLDQAGDYVLSLTSDGLGGATTDLFSVTPVAATQLVVTAQPPSIITAGAGFAVTIAAEDPFGNIDATFDGSVTLALANNPASGTLGGTLSVPAVNGLAFFSGLTIDHSGNGYTLQASKAGLTPALTSAIDITVPGVATQLVVTTQPPSGVVAGSSFGLVVAAEDSFGTVDTAFNGSVTVSDANGGIALGTITACNGAATFSGLTLDDAGDYSLSVTSNGLSAAATNSLTVRAAPASQVIVLDPIGNILSGAPFDINIVLVDSDGNIDQTFTGNVTLALANNPGSSTLGGTVIVSAVDGVATFSGLTINNSGIGYAFQATSAGLTTGTSSPFNVSNDQLVVTTQPPSTVAAGSGFGLVVAAEDGSGDVDTSFHGAVTVALNDFGGNGATLGGMLTTTAVSGVATFSGIMLDRAGKYALFVTSADVGGAVTSDLNVIIGVQVDTSTAVTSSPNPSIFGQGVTFTATVTSSGGGTPTGTVTFQDGSTALGSATLSSGTATLNISSLSVATHTVTAIYGGDSNFNGSTSVSLLQTVTQASTSTTVTSSLNPSAFGQTVIFTASVTAVSGLFDNGGTVTFSDGSTSLGTTSLSSGKATFSAPSSVIDTVSTHTITARYSGDTNFATSSGSVLQTVNQASTTTTTVTTSVVPANPPGINVANVGQTVTIKAAVAGALTTPTGTVTFLDGTISLGTGSVNGSGQATFTTSSLEATRFMGDHPHSLNAVYSGDSNFSTSPSNIVNQEIASTAQMSIPTTYISIQNEVVSVQVNFFNTTTAGAIQNSSNSLDEFDIAITYDTTRLSTPSDGSGVSPGNVTGHAGNAPNGNPWAFVINAGVDPNYDPSNNLGRITIDGYTPCGGLEGFTGGSLVNIAFTVLSNAPVGGAIINLRQSVTSVYPCTLPTAAHSTSSSDAAQGNYFLMGGLNNAGPSDQAGDSLDGLITIHNGVNSTTTLTSSTNPSVFGQSVTFTATVNGADSGTLTGTVTFNDNGTSIGTGSVTGGLATFTTTTLTVATHTITAVYGGDNDYFASSGSLKQTVNDGLIVSSFMATATGFAAVFNHALNLGDAFTPILNLYDNSTGTLGPADVTLVGKASGTIRGSLVVDQNNTRITFIQTGQTGVLGSAAQSTLFGVLPNDTYTVTLRSASNGFQDTNGNLLDGNADGTQGDDFVTTFVVNNSSNSVTVTLPDFARGPGQLVNLPNTASANSLPLRLCNGINFTGSTTNGSSTVSVLTISGLLAGNTVTGPGIPDGATILAVGPGNQITLSQNATLTSAPLANGGVVLNDSSGSQTITSVSLTLAYNPSLLNVTGYSIAGLSDPGDSAVTTFDTSTAGLVNISFTTSTGIVLGPGGSQVFLSLQSNVPSTAGYQAKEILDLQNIQINGGSITALDDDAIHVSGFLGDATGDGIYTGLDAQRISRVAVGLDTGFRQWVLADPLIVGDVSGDNVLTGLDALQIAREAVGITQSNIPILSAMTPTIAGPDPVVSIGQAEVRGQGSEVSPDAQPGSMVVVPVNLNPGLTPLDSPGWIR